MRTIKAKKTGARRTAGVVVARAKEPSTWAGAGIIATGLAALFPEYAIALKAAAVIAGGVAIVRGEQGGRGGVDGDVNGG